MKILQQPGMLRGSSYDESVFFFLTVINTGERSWMCSGFYYDRADLELSLLKYTSYSQYEFDTICLVFV